MRKRPTKRVDLRLLTLIAIPICVALWVWFSALSFVPSPWPDDSAFYFVARELFRWPPRWVMLPQAPFEPTYRIFNFNTMPLYPILIGLGRWVGIDGSFLLKFWPLSAWAISGSVLVGVLYKKGLPFLACALLAFGFALDPESRWASVLVRPESLIGLFGMILVLGLTFDFPDRWKPRGLWDPIAALLALGAYAHFNAIHLLFPVLLTFALNPRRLVQIGTRTLLYLSPWLTAVLIHWRLFFKQMTTQWMRLAVPNSWLSKPSSALTSLFQALGSPEPWPEIIYWGSVGIWFVLIAGTIIGVIVPLFRIGISWWLSKTTKATLPQYTLTLLPAFGWMLGAIWIYDSKPEVWFIYYFHVAFWCFAGICGYLLWQSRAQVKNYLRAALLIPIAAITLIFGYIDVTQAIRLGNTKSWSWSTYYDYIDCIDRRLSEVAAKHDKSKPFKVWDPTPPDVTIELSRRHPTWEFTRTNDFLQPDRIKLALQHGWETEAVVVSENLNWPERTVSAKAELVPEIQSLWMNWKDYFLNQLYTSPGWKPHRYICQRGRWQAFIFTNQ